jgi:Rps23 Pro-64 3,4-dihydroxylase Tpa1-like proline 4-hydroxylase
MDLKEWIKGEYLSEDYLGAMNKEFASGRPFKHIFLREFLKENKANELAEALKGENFERKESDLFSFSQTYDLQDSDNDLILDFVEFLQCNEFSTFIEKIIGVPLKEDALDLFGSLYEDTDHLLCHDDLLEDRKIAYLFYLGDDFLEKDGGALEMYSDKNGGPDMVEKKYSPIFNGFAMFAVSGKSWHSVGEVIGDKKRYAIGGWMH